jgi:hypothetical protein
MTTYNYKLTTYTADQEAETVTYGKGGWDFAKARKNRDAALRRTDKIEGLYASATIVWDSEQEAS